MRQKTIQIQIITHSRHDKSYKRVKRLPGALRRQRSMLRTRFRGRDVGQGVQAKGNAG